jgi:diacylglycerol kinase (ATP)
MRVLVVFNQKSGSAEDAPREAILEALSSLGQASAIEPGKEEFAAAVDAAAAEADLVVAAGGDGTVNRTVNAIRDHLDRVAFALVPLGTGNDFARTLGVPDDPEEAARGIADWREREVDVCEARGAGVRQLFVNACIGGFPVEVDEHVNETIKKMLGPLAYVAAGAQAAAGLSRSTVTMNGRRVEDCVAAGVGNGRTCGGGVRVWPEADPGDGALDGCAMSARGLIETVKLAATVRGGSHVDLDGVVTDRAAEITIEAEPEIEFNVDGELLGLTSPATFRVVGKLRVRVPGS